MRGRASERRHETLRLVPADLINAAFELLAVPFVVLSILKLTREKLVRGISWIHHGFFCAWGLWNLYYYPSLGQWWSAICGALLAAANLLYLGLMLHYVRKERRCSRGYREPSTRSA